VRRIKLLPDLTPFRASRNLRLVVGGNFVSNLGAQASLVALPYQLYVLTHSAFLVGMLGAAELGPLVFMSLVGGALADRSDRRRLLLLTQIGVFACAGGLAIVSFAGHPVLASLYVLGGLLAGFNALQNAARSAVLPGLVADRELLAPAIALSYGLSSLTMVLGPALGGILIALFGVEAAYTIDALSCLAVVFTVLPLPPMHASQSAARAQTESIRRSIADGLRYVRGNKALVGSFGADLVAMTFGMPRALFAVLAVSVYHAGAGGTGVLYASVAAGGTVAALLTGWIKHARRLGRIVIIAVAAWGIAIALAGLMSSLWLAAAMLALAGAADSVSAVCRSTINQTVTPEAMRGRMSSVFGLVVTGGPRLGDLESGSVAGAAGVRFSVVSGGLACLVGIGAIMVGFPALARYDTADWTDEPTAPESAESPVGVGVADSALTEPAGAAAVPHATLN
jgi:MFS family permease